MPLGDEPQVGEVRAIHEDVSGTVWLSNLVQLKRSDPRADLVTHVLLYGDGDGSFAAQIASDPGTNVWVRGNQMFRITAPAAWAVFPSLTPRGDDVTALLAYLAGTLWIAFEKAGLLLYREAQLVPPLTDGDPPITGVTCLLQDREGSVWAGTRDDGLIELLPQRCVVYGRSDVVVSHRQRSGRA